MSERPPSDRRSVDRPNDWLYDTLTRMEETELRHAKEIREAYHGLLKKFEDHEKVDDGVEKRVTKIEILREAEGKELIKASAIVSIMASGLIVALVQAVKSFFGH